MSKDVANATAIMSKSTTSAMVGGGEKVWPLRVSDQ
jgi:hypothetical protein